MAARHRLSALVAATTLVLFALPGSVATAEDYPGPPLQASPEAMAAVVRCTPNAANAKVNPVLLVHGTGGADPEYWGWNYERSLPTLGVPVCTVSLPQRATISIPISNEYVVYAIRHVHELSKRKVSLIGHSQGGTHLLWSLRFWPDLPGKVDDVIAISSDFHGTALGNVVCLLPCTAISWQARIGSEHLARITRDPLPEGPSFTTVQTIFDQVVFPSPAAGRLDGAANFTVQQFCPIRYADHATILVDAVAWQVVVDALTHHGPADASRIDADCGQLFMPAVTPIGVVGMLPTILAAAGGITGITQPTMSSEPPLPAYTRD